MDLNREMSYVCLVSATGVKTATLSDSNSCSGKLAWIKQSSRRAGGTSGLSEKCLEELKEVDPKRAKRIVSNREVLSIRSLDQLFQWFN